MTHDDIIRMAVECQLVTTGNRDGIYMEALERFANLVVAAEREACARVCEETDSEVFNKTGCPAYGSECAAAIRAMGEE